MAYPKITVAIPIYNAGRYLDYAIKSTLNQTFSDFELLLINDGSTDNSLSIMQKYEHDPRVTVIDDGLNRGLIYRLNQSIDLAKGEYYARMDADDIMHPERLQKQFEYLELNKNIDVLGTACYILDVNNNIIGYRNACNRVWDKSILINSTPFCHPSVMGKTAWFKKIHYNAKWLRAEDYELWLRSSSFSNYHNLEEKLLYYRECGVPTYSKYIKSMLTGFRLLIDYKQLGISLVLSIKQVAKIIFKILIYSFFYMIRQTNFLVNRRYIRIKTFKVIEI